jgi:hypothetical protein
MSEPETEALLAFIRVRLDEDEARARSAARHMKAIGPFSGRLLRQAEAMRAVLGEFGSPSASGGPYPLGLMTAVKHLGASWRDHPDYREEWRP